MKIPLTGQTNTTRSIDVDYQLTQNWYPAIEQTGKNQLVLYPTPGLTEFCTAGTGPIRGQLKYGSLLYVVSNNKLYEITTGGSVTERGTLNTSSGNVSMTHNGPNNGQQIFIADGTNGYIFDSSAVSFAVISDADYPDTGTMAEFMDGYFITNDPTNDGRFYVSNGYDGTAWDTNAFATAERNPDKLVAIHVNGRELWLLGEETSEVWYNAGTTPVPFNPMSSGFIEIGCAAAFSVASYAGTMLWLSQNSSGQGQVVMSSGLSPKVISTSGISTKIHGFTTISDAVGYIYQSFGHIFYVLTFPTEQATLVYDVTTQMWHEWVSDTIVRHKGQNHAFFNGKHVVGDYNSGKLYYLDYDVYTDDGDTIARIRRSPHIHADGKRVFHKELEVLIEGGVGNGAVADPQIMMRYSDDGGHTWSSEKWRDMGAATGEYGKTPTWRRLGSSKDRVYEIKVTDAVKAVIIDGYVDIVLSARTS